MTLTNRVFIEIRLGVSRSDRVRSIQWSDVRSVRQLLLKLLRELGLIVHTHETCTYKRHHTSNH